MRSLVAVELRWFLVSVLVAGARHALLPVHTERIVCTCERVPTNGAAYIGEAVMKRDVLALIAMLCLTVLLCGFAMRDVRARGMRIPLACVCVFPVLATTVGECTKEAKAHYEHQQDGYYVYPVVPVCLLSMMEMIILSLFAMIVVPVTTAALVLYHTRRNPAECWTPASFESSSSSFKFRSPLHVWSAVYFLWFFIVVSSRGLAVQSNPASNVVTVDKFLFAAAIPLTMALRLGLAVWQRWHDASFRLVAFYIVGLLGFLHAADTVLPWFTKTFAYHQIIFAMIMAGFYLLVRLFCVVPALPMPGRGQRSVGNHQHGGSLPSWLSALLVFPRPVQMTRNVLNPHAN